MKKKNTFLTNFKYIAFLCTCAVLSSCLEDKALDILEELEVEVTAVAGDDLFVSMGKTVALDGSGSSSSDGSDVTFFWSITTAPDTDFEFTDTETATPDFSAIVPGEYVINLTVTSSSFSDSKTDEIIVTVLDDGPARLSGTISSDMILVNRFKGADSLDYIVNGDLTVNGATLTIMPGVNIAFETDLDLSIENSGTLIAIGKEDSLINFLGTTETPGHWRGISVFSGNVNNKLSFVRVSHAGSSEIGYGIPSVGLGIESDSKIAIENSIFSQNSGYGLFIENGGQLLSFIENHFESNTTPLGLSASAVGSLDEASTYLNNTSNMIELLGSSLTEPTEVNWTGSNDGTPFFVTGNIIVDTGLSISGAVEFRFASDTRISVDGGYLNVTGSSADERVRFLGKDEVAGSWEGIQFFTSDLNNSFNFVEIAHGGSSARGYGLEAANIAVNGPDRFEIHNSIIHSSGGYGMFMETNSILSGFSLNEFRDNTGIPLGIDANNVAALDQASTFSGNGDDSIELFGSTLDNGIQVSTWQSITDGTPFFVSGNLSIESGLVIEAGATFEFGTDYYLQVDDEGYLSVEGNSTSFVSFIGKNPVAGSWQGIQIFTNSLDNSFDFVVIAHGGSSARGYGIPKSNIGINGGDQASITNSVIRDCDGTGIFVEANGTINSDVATSNTFSNNVLNLDIQ